ncbi:MAG: metallophosphoesterase [Bacillota bacterium]|nr:metallophosphoesterase [Bacillota bacterium]
MKAGVISDIHIDEQAEERAFEEVFAACINESGIELLLIAGDFSEYYMRTLSFVRRLRGKIRPELYYCLGNHDYWSKFEEAMDIPAITGYLSGPRGDRGFVQNRAVALSDETVLVAGCGWYDYSFAFPGQFTEEELQRREYMGRVWRDRRNARHGKSDKEAERDWTGALLQLVDQYKDKKVILMTHMVNHPAFLVGEDHRLYEMFRYFNGFMGSEGLYRITRRPNVKVAVSGHVHYRKSFWEEGTYYTCRCLGYPSEFPAFGGEQELAAQIKDAMEIIEI